MFTNWQYAFSPGSQFGSSVISKSVKLNPVEPFAFKQEDELHLITVLGPQGFVLFNW